MDAKVRVLILCTGNSARSQMAEGLLRHIGAGRFEVASAGTHPTPVKAEAIQVMKEIGIDVSSQRSKSVDEFHGAEFDYVITVCDNANESCPIFTGAPQRIHWSLSDPAAVADPAERLDAFRQVRDVLRVKLDLFAEPWNLPDARSPIPDP